MRESPRAPQPTPHVLARRRATLLRRRASCPPRRALDPPRFPARPALPAAACSPAPRVAGPPRPRPPAVPAAAAAMAAPEDAPRLRVPGGTTAAGAFVAAAPPEEDPAAPVLSLSNSGVVSADLRGLPPATASLSLAANALTALDLRPLAAAPQLQALILNGNALAAIDLAPLASCPALERLWLHNNAITEIDLRPLAACTALRSLYLDANRLDAQTVDLAPLAAASASLRALRFGRNRLGGALDITPLLRCSALSALDICASVKLSARTADAVPAPLPPALRRRAATVCWTQADADSDSESASSADSLSADRLAAAVADLARSQAADPLHQRHTQQQHDQAPLMAPTTTAAPVALPEAATLAALASTLRPSPPVRAGPALPRRAHAAVMVGFRTHPRFAAEALLLEHVRLDTAHVQSPAPDSAAALTGGGALDRIAVFLVRPDAAALVAALRALDRDLPIVVVGTSESADAAPTAKAGATCFMEEPLEQRHALTIRALAQTRIKSKRAAANDAAVVAAPRQPPPSQHQPTPGDCVGAPVSVVPAVVTATQSAVCVARARAPPPVRDPRSRTPAKAMPAPARGGAPQRGPRRPPTIDFDRLRERTAGVSSSRSSRVEAAAVGMLFSRCGGRAFAGDFYGIATLCGLPVCCASNLHAAAKVFGRTAGGKVAVSPALSPVSIMAFGPAATSPQTVPGRRSGGSEEFEFDRQAEGVSYETFQEFWTVHLRHRDAETRLYNVLKTSHMSEGGVPAAAIHELAATLVSTRPSDMDAEDRNLLAAAVLCFELKGGAWHWIRRQELSSAKLAATLLAAEAGMFQGVAAHLRADRLADIRAAFAAASGQRFGTVSRLPCKDIAWLNKERGMLSHRAVEAIFTRHGLDKAGGMDLAHFAPMWLAVSNPSSRSATEYLFAVLDADADGYLTAPDVAHFYAEKRNVLMDEGFVPTVFEHVWVGLLDSALQQRSGSHRRVSLQEVRQMGSRDSNTLFQSLLFLDDGEMIDMRETARVGSPSAMTAVSVW